MKFLVLTSLAFTVGQFWIAGLNWLRRRRGQPEMRRVASIPLHPGRLRSIRTTSGARLAASATAA